MFRDKVKEGACSIIDLTYKGTRWPLWIITYWREWSERRRSMGLWTKAVSSARVALRTLAWGQELRAYGSRAPLDHLSQIVSDGWLGDEVLNVLLLGLYARARLDTRLADQVIIAPATLDYKIRTTESKDYDHATLLLRYRDNIRRLSLRFLYFLSFVNDNHWIAVCVDFESKCIKYGDSSPHAGPPRFMKKLLGWLKHAFKSNFRDGGNNLPHGTQTDSHSCGPCAVNCVEHAVFGTGLFTPNARRLWRLRYFNQLVLEHENYLPYLTRSADESDGRLPSEIPLPPSSGPSDTDTDVDMSDSTQDMLDDEAETPGAIPGHEDISFRTSKRERSATVTALNSRVIVKHMKTSQSDIWDAPSHSPPLPLSSPLPMPPTSESSVMLGLPASVAPLAYYGVVGISRSNRAQAKLKEKMKDSTFVINETKLANFRDKCLHEDPHAKFRVEETPWRVLHSPCESWVATGAAYNASAFVTHSRMCKKKNKSRTSTLDSLWGRKTPAPTPNLKQPSAKVAEKPDQLRRPSKTSTFVTPTVACRGITAEMEPRVMNLVQRGVKNGGGRSDTDIADEVYGRKLGVLKKTEKGEVRRLQLHSRTWDVDPNNTEEMVVARDCRKVVAVDAKTPLSVAICEACLRIWRSQSFKVALNKKVPDAKNTKYTNTKYVDKHSALAYAKVKGLQAIFEEAAEGSVYVRYVTGVLNGEFEDRKVFNGLLSAIVHANDRKKQGKGLQNFQYAPHLEEFAHIALLTSPDVYRLMKPHFQLPSERGFQMCRAAMPRFSLTICERTFDNVVSYITARKYTGPLAVSCDDTKLHATMRTYWDEAAGTHFLIGHTQDPIPVASPEALQDLLQSNTLVKETKAPMPKIPPIIIAMMAIPGNLSAETLYNFTFDILSGLIRRGLKVISYSLDGTESERKIQHLLVEQSPFRFRFVIPHHPQLPQNECKDLVIYTLTILGKPFSPQQDTKHVPKTVRNNNFTGTKFFILGNSYASYSEVRHLASGSKGVPPLYHRDVEKVDQQDDNAATRLFSSASLEYLSKHFPEKLGQIVYLFIFGKLTDSFQSRTIGHLDRIKMALLPASLLEGLTNAMVGKPDAVHPQYRALAEGVHGIVLYQKKLYVGRVLSAYSQGGGKSATHAWWRESRNIGSLSYISLQLFEHSYRLTFRGVHGKKAALQVMTFVHTDSDSFLWALPRDPTTRADQHNIELDAESFAIFTKLQLHASALNLAVAELGHLRRGRKKAVGDNEEN
ncbi:hypothetical protein OF83DRAFT_1083107 [Amylostereum chailletii]|nr:hypothetical protein OF83DRAFT_1083107 [Amylostereum chailletii]